MNDKPGFVDVGVKFADIITQAAEDLLTETTNLHAKTKVLADSIRQQVIEHRDMMADINKRVQALGQVMIEAHEKFLEGK